MSAMGAFCYDSIWAFIFGRVTQRLTKLKAINEKKIIWRLLTSLLWREKD